MFALFSHISSGSRTITSTNIDTEVAPKGTVKKRANETKIETGQETEVMTTGAGRAGEVPAPKTCIVHGTRGGMVRATDSVTETHTIRACIDASAAAARRRQRARSRRSCVLLVGTAERQSVRECR